MLPQLSTARCQLRPVEAADQPFIFSGLSHPQVVPFYAVQYKTLAETSAQMQYYSQLQKEGTGGWWVIVEASTQLSLGAIGFNNFVAHHRSCEIGYWLLPQFWHKGIVAEVLPHLLQLLFTDWKMHRVAALVEVENKASAAVLRRAGFTLEGTLRDCEWKDGEPISLHSFSLLGTDERPSIF